jgi:hypothetical protein
MRAALDREGELPLKEIEALLIEAGETIELLQPLLEPCNEVGLVRSASKDCAKDIAVLAASTTTEQSSIQIRQRLPSFRDEACEARSCHHR